MTQYTIKLPHGKWTFDDRKPLGPPGGFGEVFRGSGTLGEVAIKRLHLTARRAARRELSIGQYLEGRAFSHVVPILDAGQDSESDRYFLVMPICGRSLQDSIDESDQTISLDEALSIVSAILQGLL